MGKSGKCVVDETEKGWYITWIDRDPETIARQEASNKKVKLAQDDQEKEAEFIRKQVELDRLRKGEEVQSIYTALIRSDAEEKIQLGLKLPPTLDAKPINSSSKLSSNVLNHQAVGNMKKNQIVVAKKNEKRPLPWKKSCKLSSVPKRNSINLPHQLLLNLQTNPGWQKELW